MSLRDKHFSTQAILLLGALLLAVSAAAADLPSDRAVRAAMVFNFLRFTEFPAGQNDASVIRLCIDVRDTRQAAELNALAQRRLGRRNLIVEPLNAYSQECDALYVDSRQRWNALGDHPALRRALSMASYGGFARDGGMIEIAILEGGARFDVNLVEARRAGLRFAPELLLLAREIHE